MATQSEYLVRNTVNDANALIASLAQVVTITNRIVQRARALGATTWDAYEFPAGYDATQAKALITALEALPESIVENTTRNRIHKIVSIIQ